MLVPMFISCCLDYCNLLLYGVSLSLIWNVQSIQKAAARLLIGARRQDHISPVLCKQHWLPVQRRVDFKLACFVFLSLSGHTPSNLVERMTYIWLQKSPDVGSAHLQTTDRSRAVPQTHNTFGDRSFSVAGPRVWNSDEEISYNSFTRELKTYQFHGDRCTM